MRLWEELRDALARRGSFSNDLAQTLVTGVVILGLNFLTGMLVARFLGAHGRGELAAIQALPMLIATVGTFGLWDAVIYLGGRSPESVGRFAVSGAALNLLLAAPLLVAGVFWLPTFLDLQRPEIVSASQWYLLIVVPFVLAAIATYPARATRRVGLWNRLRVVPPGLWLLVVGVGLIVGTRRPERFTLAYLFVFLVIAAVLPLTVRSLLRGQARPDPRCWPRMLRFGVPTMAGNAPQMLNQRIDQFLLAGLLPAEQLGLYAVAVAWSAISTLPQNAINAVTFPRMSELIDWESQSRLIRRGLVASAAFGLLAALALAAAASFAIPFVFGEEFRPAVLVSVVLLGAAVPRGLSRTLYALLKGLGRPSGVMLSEWTALVSLVVAFTVLVPLYDTLGAALAMVVSSLVGLVASSVYLGILRRRAR